ncbi:hypothetical protein DLM85_04735 [Hymenobacter edaphi]|uniref:Uncharacterized protein n=1 Tax=Hymenobacter edaphi TaxID=2211146 RepID=A0A328BU71_9BACT|nr:hypothetical protein DLM85_04735 [Hymenobacter edaphi]
MRSSRAALTATPGADAVAASGAGAAAGAAGAAAGAAFLAGACWRLSSHSCSQGGGVAGPNSWGWRASSSSRAAPCLHGNTRLGQEHLNAGSVRSMPVW